MSDIKVGDIVYLKSGGPAMTINGKSKTGTEWSCAWFVDNNIKSADFRSDALTKDNPSPSKKPAA